MGTYFIFDEASWNNVATNSALVSFVSGDRIRLLNDITFTAPPGHIRLGAALFNGNANTLYMDFASAYSGGLFRLAGGTIRNLNINFIQPWAGTTVLLGGTTTQFGTVSYVNVVGAMSSSTAAIIASSSLPTLSQSLVVNYVSVDVSVSAGFAGLIASAFRNHNISNCSVVVNATSPGIRVICISSDMSATSSTSGVISVSKCTATVVGETSCSSAVFRLVRPLQAPSSITISEVAHFRTQSVSDGAVSNFIMHLQVGQSAGQNVVFSASDCFASCDGFFTGLYGTATNSTSIIFTRCVHVGRDTPTFFAPSTILTPLSAPLVTITNCYGRSGQAVTTTIGDGTDPIVTGTLQTPNFLIPASALSSEFWTDDVAPPVGALYPFITSLIDPNVFTGFTNTSAAPGVLVPVPTFDEGIQICFAAGTRISLANGRYCPVERLEPGMLLKSTTTPLQVKNIIQSLTSRTVYFPAHSFRGQFADLTITPWHLIFIEGLQRWRAAGHIVPGKITCHSTRVPVFNIHADKWGCIYANGVPCETVACTPEQKHLRNQITAFF